MPLVLHDELAEYGLRYLVETFIISFEVGAVFLIHHVFFVETFIVIVLVVAQLVRVVHVVLVLV